MTLEPQSTAWRDHAMELAETARAMGWEGTATLLDPDPEADTPVRRWSVPSSDDTAKYTVTVALASNAATHRMFWAFQCSCLAGRKGPNGCRHVGAALEAEAAEFGSTVVVLP